MQDAPEGGGAKRIVKDAFGEVEIPAGRLWGASTERARMFFAIGQQPISLALVHAIAYIKRCAARVHAQLGLLPPELADAIERAAAEVIRGLHDQQFPLGPWQTGSGTQTHMNVNEVIAHRANLLLGSKEAKSPVHPNDHVNLGQSSNDVFPSAMHIAAAQACTSRVGPALGQLIDALDDKAAIYADTIKLGRTHLQDATPMTLGQEISGWSAQLRLAREQLDAAMPQVLALALGGTAVGTGINSDPRAAPLIIEQLRLDTGLHFAPAASPFAALAGHEALLGLHGALRCAASALHKVCNDLRLLASGPRAGLGELQLPENEAGSSIMPGKVNPTQCEAATMVALRVLGNDTAVGMAAAMGQLELNVYKPLIATLVLESIELLSDTMHSLRKYCIEGLSARIDVIDSHVTRSLMLVTAIAPRIGYDAAAAIALHAHRQGLTLREAVLERGLMTPEDLDEALDPARLLGSATRPERPKTS